MLSVLKPKFDLASKITLVMMGFAIPVSISGFNVLLVLTVVLSLLAGDIKNKFASLRNNHVVISAMLIFLLLVVSALYSPGANADVAIALGKYSKLLYILLLMPLFVNPKWQRAGINAFLMAMLVTVCMSFFKLLGWTHIGNGGLGTIFTNHINAGFMMAFAAFITAHRCFEKTPWRWWYIALFILFTFHVFFMNEGRTGYLVLAVLLPLFLWQKFNSKGLYIAIVSLPLLLGSLFLFSPHFKQRINMIFHDMHHYQQRQLENNSIGLRLDFFKHSWILVREHPVIGTGVGSFKSEYQNNFPPDPGFAGMNNPQNEYFMMAVQLGFLGLAVFLWLFYQMWRRSFYLAHELKYLAQGLVVAFMIGCCCDSFLFLAIPGYCFIYFTSLFFARGA